MTACRLGRQSHQPPTHRAARQKNTSSCRRSLVRPSTHSTREQGRTAGPVTRVPPQTTRAQYLRHWPTTAPPRRRPRCEQRGHAAALDPTRCTQHRHVTAPHAAGWSMPTPDHAFGAVHSSPVQNTRPEQTAHARTQKDTSSHTPTHACECPRPHGSAHTNAHTPAY